ncbi:MAG TPA: hypothetical protein VGL39_10590 [Jatrophihabitantaceae bacterium]
MTYDPQSARHGNGLDADTWVPLVDVDPEVGEALLVALGRARIPAYVEPAGEPDRRRLFVASADRGDARIVVEAATRGSDPLHPLDVLDGVDTNAEFDALVGEWDVDTLGAVKSAERDLTREDADWRARLEPGFPDASAADDEEHYVPPAPPPLPRLAGATVFALFVLALSIVLLAIGDNFGLDPDFAFLAGVAGILVGAGMLIMRLRARPPDDEDDDGAVI